VSHAHPVLDHEIGEQRAIHEHDAFDGRGKLDGLGGKSRGRDEDPFVRAFVPLARRRKLVRPVARQSSASAPARRRVRNMCCQGPRSHGAVARSFIAMNFSMSMV
jgi:hypothetical protein